MKPITNPAGSGPARALRRDLVLYVEDEPENREVAELRLSRTYELLLAANDREACEILKERGADLAAVLMDIQLRGSALNGIELTQLIRGRLKGKDLPSYAANVPTLRVPVIFVTAYGDKYPEADLKDAGGVELVAKPVDFAALTMAITRAHLSRLTR